MFTGIIEGKCRIINAEPGVAAMKLGIDIGDLSRGVKIGDSIAVNGVCLTVNRFSGTMAYFDVLGETVGLTNIGKLRTGDQVNIERALAFGDRLGGHLVQGHVDGLGKVMALKKENSDVRLSVKVSEDMAKNLVLKGSVAINGVSLTIAAVTDDSFDVALVAHTLASTTLPNVKTGDELNIETDILGKYVRNYLKENSPVLPTDGKRSLSDDDIMSYGY